MINKSMIDTNVFMFEIDESMIEMKKSMVR
jgi:hypothetical protein